MAPGTSTKRLSKTARQRLMCSASSPPLGGEVGRGGYARRFPLSSPLPLAGERNMRERNTRRIDNGSALLVRGFELAQQLVAALDRIVERGLGVLLAAPHGFQLLVLDVADLDEVADAQALGVLGRRIE